MENSAKMYVIFVLGAILGLSECTAPSRWTTPYINSRSGSARLAQTLSETLAVGTKVGSVTLNNYPTAYVITRQTYDGMFYVSRSGQNGDIYLYNNTFLDYETATSVVVVIKGSNADGSGTVTLTITVTDENDNTPTFSSSTYTTHIASTYSNDSAIYTVVASDADSTTNKHVNYAIASGDDTSMKFSMVAASGEIKRTGQSFTTNLYALVITAIDGGSPPRTGTTTLTVCIDGCSSGVQVMVSALVTAIGILSSRMLGTIAL